MPADCSPEHLQELQSEQIAGGWRMAVLIQIVNTSNDPAVVATAQEESHQLTRRLGEIEDDLAACEP